MRDKFQTILRIEEMIKSHRYDAYTDCVLKDAFVLLGQQEQVVHCKDCIYKPITIKGKHETYYVFPEDYKCPCQCCDDEFYSWAPDDDWFCANGRREPE